MVTWADDGLEHALEAEGLGHRYRTEYRRSGQTVTVSCELAAQVAGSVCGERDLGRWKTLFAKLQRDLRAQMVYR